MSLPDDEPLAEDKPRPPEPPTDRELLEKISNQLRRQQQDIDTIRWRTGCLYAWLVAGLVLGALGLLIFHH